MFISNENNIIFTKSKKFFFYGNLDNLVKGRNKKRKLSAKGNKS